MLTAVRTVTVCTDSSECFCFVLFWGFLKTMTSEGAKRQKLYIQAEKATLLLLAQTEKSF